MAGEVRENLSDVGRNLRSRRETGDGTFQRKVKTVKRFLDLATRMSSGEFLGLNFSVGIDAEAGLRSLKNGHWRSGLNFSFEDTWLETGSPAFLMLCCCQRWERTECLSAALP